MADDDTTDRTDEIRDATSDSDSGTTDSSGSTEPVFTLDGSANEDDDEGEE